ncbi:MAG: hypothetical protein M1814_000053 [Vezdaea aestivalis]|nr:MAG: hypothetical protein M1814_000053 [Vezdaea aestivalis]
MAEPQTPPPATKKGVKKGAKKGATKAAPKATKTAAKPAPKRTNDTDLVDFLLTILAQNGTVVNYDKLVETNGAKRNTLQKRVEKLRERVAKLELTNSAPEGSFVPTKDRTMKPGGATNVGRKRKLDEVNEDEASSGEGSLRNAEQTDGDDDKKTVVKEEGMEESESSSE